MPGRSFLTTEKFDAFVRNLNSELYSLKTGVSGYPGLVEAHHENHEEGGSDMLVTGIADTDLIKVDGSPADDEFARWTAAGLEGRTYAETLDDLSGEATGAFDWNAQDLTNIEAITSSKITTGFVTEQLIDIDYTVDPSADASAAIFRGVDLDVSSLNTNVEDIYGLYGLQFTVIHNGSGAVEVADGVIGDVYIAPGAGDFGLIKGIWGGANAQGGTGSVYGVQGHAHASGGNLATIRGGRFRAQVTTNDGIGVTTNANIAQAIYANVYVGGTATYACTIDTYTAGLVLDQEWAAFSVVPLAYGIYLPAPTDTVSPTDYYGIYLGDHSGIGSVINWGMYIAGGDIYFGDKLNLGTVADAGADVDKFLVWDVTGNIDYRTGAEVLADLSGDAGATFDWNDQRLENVLSLEVKDLSVNTILDYIGFENVHKKTAGVTDANDDFYAHDNYVALDQAGGVIGYLSAIYTEAWLIDGTISHDLEAIYNKVVISGGVCSGDVIGSTDFIDMNGGSIDDLFGHITRLDVEAALTISGDVYGHYIEADIDTDPTGDVYMLYLKEYSNVDYGFYQDGTAPNVLGGSMSAAANLDVTSVFGRARIGYMGTADQASFAHYDKNTSTNYALKQSAAGYTYLNAPTGTTILLRINDATKAIVNATGIDMATGKIITLTTAGIADTTLYTGLTIKNLVVAGGWARDFFTYTDNADVAYTKIGVKGTAQVFNYGYIGEAYNDVALTWDAAENVGIGVYAWGTNAEQVLAQGTGVAPTTSLADCFQMYSADVGGVAGKAGVHFRDEVGNITSIGDGKFLDSSGAISFGNENLSTTGSMSAGSGTFGAGANYAAFAADGELSLAGTARVTKGAWIAAGAIKAPGAKPATEIAHGTLETPAWQFADQAVAGNQETISFSMKIPDDMDRSAAPTLGIGWSADGISPGVCEWQLEYLWRSADEDTTAAAQETLAQTGTASATSNGMVFTSISGIDVPSGTDICIHARITRLSAGGNDTIADTVELHGICLNYTANKLGVAT